MAETITGPGECAHVPVTHEGLVIPGKRGHIPCQAALDYLIPALITLMDDSILP